MVQLVQTSEPKMDDTIVQTKNAKTAAVVKGLKSNLLYNVYIAGYNNAGRNCHIITKIKTFAFIMCAVNVCNVTIYCTRLFIKVFI